MRSEVADAAIGWLHYDLGELDEASLCFERVLQAPGVAHDGDLVSAVQRSSGNVASSAGVTTRRGAATSRPWSWRSRFPSRSAPAISCTILAGSSFAAATSTRPAGASPRDWFWPSKRADLRAPLLAAPGPRGHRRAPRRLRRGAGALDSGAGIARSIGYPALAAGLLRNLEQVGVSARGDADEARRFLSQALAFSDQMKATTTPRLGAVHARLACPAPRGPGRR